LFASHLTAKTRSIVRGDKVTVINGPFQGQGGIVKVVLRKNNRLLVEGQERGASKGVWKTTNRRQRRRAPALRPGRRGEDGAARAGAAVDSLLELQPRLTSRARGGWKRDV
jgi:hypothetical protein